MGFVICGALCHAEEGNEQGMAYQTGPGVSEAVRETINSGTTTNVLCGSHPPPHAARGPLAEYESCKK